MERELKTSAVPIPNTSFNMALSWFYRCLSSQPIFLRSIYCHTPSPSQSPEVPPQKLVAGFPPRRPGFDSRPDHAVFVVDKVVLGQAFFEYFGFPWKFSFHSLLHTHHLSSGVIQQAKQWPTCQVNSVSSHSKNLKRNEKSNHSLPLKLHCRSNTG
jgi:hypothetical protein